MLFSAPVRETLYRISRALEHGQGEWATFWLSRYQKRATNQLRMYNVQAGFCLVVGERDAVLLNRVPLKAFLLYGGAGPDTWWGSAQHVIWIRCTRPCLYGTSPLPLFPQTYNFLQRTSTRPTQSNLLYMSRFLRLLDR